jgi:uncharacterized protein
MRFYITEQLSEHISETPEGYLLCQDVPITRLGEFIYKQDEMLGHDGKPIVQADSDGLVKIQRDADEVFSDITVRSFEGKPFTINHPNGFVGPDNWGDLAHGTIQNVHQGTGEKADLLLADILATTSEAKELILSGQREISCGYDAEYEQIDVGRGRQKEIIGNHVALVPKGRAGSRCAIADSTSVDACGNFAEKTTEGQEAKEMAKQKLTLAERFKRWFDSCPIKDEDSEQAEAELEAELEKQKKEEEEGADDKDKTADKKTKDDDGDFDSRLAALESKMDDILDLLEDLMAEEETEQKTEDDDDDDDEKDDDKKDTEDDDDDGEDNEKEKGAGKKEVEDSWSDFVSYADVLLPGVRLVKPTRDHRRTMDSIKVGILNEVLTDKEMQPIISGIVGGKNLAKMTHDSLDVMFRAASQLVGQSRNRKVQNSSVTVKDHIQPVARAVADINQKNKDFWKKK